MIIGLLAKIFALHVVYKNYNPNPILGTLFVLGLFACGISLGRGVVKQHEMDIKLSRALLAMGIAYSLVMIAFEIYFFVLHPFSHMSLKFLFLAKFIALAAVNYLCLKQGSLRVLVTSDNQR